MLVNPRQKGRAEQRVEKRAKKVQIEHTLKAEQEVVPHERTAACQLVTLYDDSEQAKATVSSKFARL